MFFSVARKLIKVTQLQKTKCLYPHKSLYILVAMGKQCQESVEESIEKNEYLYKRAYIRKDGSIGEYLQKRQHVPILKRANQNEYIDELFKRAKVTRRQMKLIHMYLNDILHFKGYYKKNTISKINKVSSKGEITKNMEMLLLRAVAIQGYLSDELEEIITNILNYYDCEIDIVKDVREMMREFEKR